MKLYSGPCEDFIEDAIQDRIANKLSIAFLDYFGYKPNVNESLSWKYSLKQLSDVIKNANIYGSGMMLEYQLPLSSMRLDCIIAGYNETKNPNAVIIELKQWDKTEQADGENEILSWVGGAKRELLHPSVQVGRYKMYLEDTQTVFYDDKSPINLSACAFLHNYEYIPNDPILMPKFLGAIALYPLFSKNQFDDLANFLSAYIGHGEGLDLIQRIDNSEYRPSKKLLDHVGNIIKGNSDYILVDEQLIVYDKVIACARKALKTDNRTVIIIRGGPGTGKSVIALNIMSNLSLQGYNTQYATGSKAFTQTLRKIIGARGAIQFKYFNSYITSSPRSIDVIVADESHRIRENSQNRFTPKRFRTDTPQIHEIINASRVSVFFIDDKQVVRPNEIGSSDYIREQAQKLECEIFEYDLMVQFRCSGSDAFIQWINNTLGISRSADVLWNKNENFDFQIFPSVEALDSAIRKKASEGFSARMTAGFCWPWSDPRPDGTLISDVKIGNYERPWNAKPDATRLAKGIPKATVWAYEPSGIDQIGCIYTAQGFEFDYVGVIFGTDLVYDFDQHSWVGHPYESQDSVVKRSHDKFLGLVKNVYRVLLSRGMKGCYVFFMDKDTERFVHSRME